MTEKLRIVSVHGSQEQAIHVMENIFAPRTIRYSMTEPLTAEDRRMDGELETEIIRLRTENERLRASLNRIIDAYDAYRARGVMPAPDQYQAVVVAIEEARAAAKAERAEIIAEGRE